MIPNDRLAITGIGMRTSLGSDAKLCFAAMCEGRTGLKPLQHFEREKFKAKAAYEIERGTDDRETHGRAVKLLASAIEEALADSDADLSTRKALCFVGTGLAELRSVELWWTRQDQPDPNAFSMSDNLRQSVTGLGEVEVIVNACAASLFALAAGADAICTGETDRAVIGGVDILTESMFGLLDRVQISPPNAVRPFDQNRIGVLMGDGAAAVVIERESSARQRGARIHAVIGGIGLSCDAKHETAPSVEGMARAIRLALDQAKVRPADLDFVLVHGTGTQLNDLSEFKALHSAFGEEISRVPLSAVKSMTGHTSGASGLVGVVTAVMALHSDVLPPTAGHQVLMTEASGIADVVTERRGLERSQRSMVNAFGFGGVNASVVMEKYTQ